MNRSKPRHINRKMLCKTPGDGRMSVLKEIGVVLHVFEETISVAGCVRAVGLSV